MKKIIIIAICASFLSNTIAVADALSPAWDEVCPPKYLYAKYQENHYNTAENVLLALTIVGLPFACYNKAKFEKIDTSNYWVQRKRAFDNELATCKSDPINQAQCFMQIRQLELNKNALYQQNEIAKRQEKLHKIQNIQTINALNDINRSINKPQNVYQDVYIHY